MDKKAKLHNSFTVFTKRTKRERRSLEKHPRRRNSGVLFMLILIGFLAACGNEVLNKTNEIKGTQEERVAAVSKIITHYAPLPSLLIDANFVEVEIGGGQRGVGPTDFKSFVALSVAPADLPAWRAVMVPLEEQNNPPHNATPEAPYAWWLPAADFSRLEFYSPKLLTGRINGWVGIAPDGRIFMYSFTM